MDRTFLLVGALAGFVGVALGAFGAHGLRTRLSTEMLAVFETGVRYQMYHAFAILIVALAAARLDGWLIRAAGWLFTAGIVTSNSPVTLTAKYSSSGFTYDAVTNLTVLNLPAPVLALPKLAGTNFTMRVTGVSNRLHVIEATTDLTPPTVWQPLGTNNLSASGLWSFTNAVNPHPRRFFRAREVD